MRVSVLDVSQPSGLPLVRFRCAFGSGTACWDGDAPEAGGEYTVELDVERDLHWGRELRPTEVSSPEVRDLDGALVLRGLLEVTVDGHAVLRLGDSLTLLGPVAGMAASANGSWVELVVDARDVRLYPYQT